ncbi:MAG: hypothetical protein M9899_00450 [Bdellovibrionaceae bacterium]|nr:hypothetical protein [Pseudobdellovibrionaceae bacterium]
MTQIFLGSTLFVMIFFGFLFVFSELGKEKPADPENYVDIRRIEKKIDDAVNQHMRSVDMEKRMRDLMISERNVKMTESFKNKAKNWEPEKPYTGSGSVGIYDEDLGETGTQDFSSLSIEEKLRVEMADRKRAAEDAARSKREYIEAYKKNALKDGWIVEINDNLEIISAKRAQEN